MLNKNQSFYCGIDTHKQFHQAVLLNRFEEQIEEFHVNNNQKDILEFVAKLREIIKEREVAIGIEGSFHLGHLLSEILVKEFNWVYEINSIYTKEKRFCETNWSKSDQRDAKLLASILIRKIDSLPRMSREHTHNRVFKRLKNLLSLWDDIAQEMRRSKNQLHHLLYQQDTQYQKQYKDITGKKVLKKLVYRFSHQGGIVSKHIVWKAKRIRELKQKKEELLETISKELNSLDWQLQTLDGVGPVNALTILATTHGGTKFANIWQFKRYVGCVPEKHQSGSTKKSKSSKMSQKRLYKAIYSIALTQIRKNSKAKAYYQKKLKEGKTKKQARRALMSRISSIVYGMLRTKEAYRVT